MIIKYYKEKINKNIEKLFSKQIEINFLKKILWKTLEKYPIFLSYYHYDNPNEIEILPTANIYNVICKHIIGIHTENKIGLNKDEINNLEMNNENYENEIIDEVYKMILIRYPKSESFFLNEPLIRNYQYSNNIPIIYYPILFYITNICLEIINSNKIPGEHFQNVFNKTLGFLFLLHNGFIDHAFSILRVVIEEYVYYIIYTIHNDVYTEKFKFMSKYNDENSEFLEKYNKTKGKTKNLKKRAYLNFGWVDMIPSYHDKLKKYDKDEGTNGTFPYSFQGILNYLLQLKKENNECNQTSRVWLTLINIVKDNYDAMSSYIHSQYTIYNLLTRSNWEEFKCIYFQICRCLYWIKEFYKYVCDNHKITTNINNIDVIELLNIHYEKLEKKIEYFTTINTKK